MSNFFRFNLSYNKQIKNTDFDFQIHTIPLKAASIGLGKTELSKIYFHSSFAHQSMYFFKMAAHTL